MFSGVRQGNSFYILERSTEPKLKIGQVISVSNPLFGYGTESTVDINVRVGEETMEFKKLPSNQSIITYGNITVSDTKDIMSKEVESMSQISQDILNKIDYHQKVVENCDKILQTLNPHLAKEKERDEDINNLKNKIDGLENKMDKVLTILSK